MKKSTLILAVCLLLTGCGGGGSSGAASMTLEEQLESYRTEHPYCFLPDGVDIEDSEHVQKLEGSGDGYMTYEKMGVRLPEDGNVYVYERDPWEMEHTNIFCQAAVLVTSEFFPELTDYVLIQPFTDIEPYIITYERALEIMPEGTPSLATEGDYMAELKREIGQCAPYFAAHEVMYCYDFFDLPDGTIESDPSDEAFKDIPQSPDMMFFGVSGDSTTHKQTPPDTDRSEPVYEALDLSDGRFAIKISYTQTRYGVKAEKEVYWILSGGCMHRVEFSHAPGAEVLFDPEEYLPQLELTEWYTRSDDGEVFDAFHYFPPHEY
ncbi:MAG: hypothetical protein IJ746_04000 [Ruminococcus sp.]|nr:hypothetical protein [Ruminococcus sp.]